ncbi:hypothetical protein AXG93_4142s1140 [Marchantia polymorpha subsp. ruderalis]|uniref:Uncharacterized protein n=1 Tax=Marchantia polymorpha subsp. ruderalis TaxID=1480154 RepID=A0A176WLW6_MARPO|nr:hypothetical protein AXG93_4142s1140 [Marchantia polymorpha subsp. ruderalis]
MDGGAFRGQLSTNASKFFKDAFVVEDADMQLLLALFRIKWPKALNLEAANGRRSTGLDTVYLRFYGSLNLGMKPNS